MMNLVPADKSQATFLSTFSPQLVEVPTAHRGDQPPDSHEFDVTSAGDSGQLHKRLVHQILRVRPVRSRKPIRRRKDL